MTKNVEKLFLEHLTRFQAGHDNTNPELDELIRGTSDLEAGQATILQHLGKLATEIPLADPQRQFCSMAISSHPLPPAGRRRFG